MSCWCHNMSRHTMLSVRSLHAGQQCTVHKTSQGEAPLVPGGRLQTAVQPRSQGPRPSLWQVLRPPCHRMLPAVPATGGHELPPLSWQPGSRESALLPTSLRMTSGSWKMHFATVHSSTQQCTTQHQMTNAAAVSEAGITS